MPRVNWQLIVVAVLVALILIQLAQPHKDIPQHRRPLTPNGL